MARGQARRRPDLTLVPGVGEVTPGAEPDAPGRVTPAVETSTPRIVGAVVGLNLVLVGLSILAADALSSRPGFNMAPLALGLLACGGAVLALPIVVARLKAPARVTRGSGPRA